MILKYGSKSNSKQAVRAYRLLMGFSLEDTFTVALQTATKNFQREHGLKVDGIAGPLTLAALVETLPDVEYLDYSYSVYVRAVQALVSTAIDGKYGKNTRANVIAFQATARLEQTGNVGKNDWLALFDCPYEKIATPVQTPPAPISGTNTEQPVDYKQGDKRWGGVVYTSCGNRNQTIANSGCGPTSMADIQATWVDRTITPVEMCEYAVKHGHRTTNSGTAWAFFQDIAKAYSYSGFVQTKSMATARAALKAGALVVASMGPGYWTKGGHYICLWKTDDTYMYANDPASSTRKRQKLAAFEEERKQFFIFYKPSAGGDNGGSGDVHSGDTDGDAGRDEPVAEAEKHIIDISYHKGTIDFDALAPHVSLVIPRASIGGDIDTRFVEYATAMKARNIPFGVFCYSYARDAAKGEDEAMKLVKYAGGFKPLFYCIDMEEACVTQAGVRAFVKTLRDLGAGKVGAYVAHHRYKEYRFDELRALFDFVWIPRYASPDVGQPTGTRPSWSCDLWQYSEKGKLPGINSNVDLDIITGQGHGLEWFLEGGETVPTPEPTPTPAPVSGGQTVRITGGSVNVRSGPGTGFAVLGVVHGGDALPYQDEAHLGGGVTWYAVAYDGGIGWVSGTLAELE